MYSISHVGCGRHSTAQETLGRRDSNHGEKDFRTHDKGLFGPVASVIRIDDEAAVIVATANESIFGLSGSVITQATHEGSASPPRSRVVVFVNDNVRSAPRLRFGGVKERVVGIDGSFQTTASRGSSKSRRSW